MRGMASGDSYGTWTEKTMADIATSRGIPDFVHRAIEVSKGAARREVGDLLVWVGKQLLIGSVKSRDIAVGPNDSPQRARNWLDKSVHKGTAQINGVVRTLRDKSRDLVLKSDRGVEVPWEPDALDDMDVVGVVIVNYTAPFDYYPPMPSEGIATVVIHARDWEMIHSRLGQGVRRTVKPLTTTSLL